MGFHVIFFGNDCAKDTVKERKKWGKSVRVAILRNRFGGFVLQNHRASNIFPEKQKKEKEPWPFLPLQR